MAIVHVIQGDVLGCRTVAFDEHAIRRMQERKVSEDEVLDVLRNPTQRGYRRSLSDFATGSTPPLTTGST